jgi:hypothetical protein
MGLTSARTESVASILARLPSTIKLHPSQESSILRAAYLKQLAEDARFSRGKRREKAVVDLRRGLERVGVRVSACAAFTVLAFVVGNFECRNLFCCAFIVFAK